MSNWKRKFEFGPADMDDCLVAYGPRRLVGSVQVSGSKNAGLIALIASLLTEERTVIRNLPGVSDIFWCKEALKTLGCRVTDLGKSTTVVRPAFSTFEVPSQLTCRTRASICLLGALLAARRRAVIGFPGGCPIGWRPIDIHLKSLQRMGATFEFGNDFIKASTKQLMGADMDMLGPHGTTVTGTCNVLLAASRAKGKSNIRNAAQEPEVCSLGELLISMGARIEGLGTSHISVYGVPDLKGVTLTNRADRVEAATICIAAAISRGEVELVGAPIRDMKSVLEFLKKTGCSVDTSTDAIMVRAPEKLVAQDIKAKPFPGLPTDIQPMLGVLMSTVPACSSVQDFVFPARLAYLQQLKRFGIPSYRMNNTTRIQGADHISGAVVRASDIRTAAALLLLANFAEGKTSIIDARYHLARGYEDVVGQLQLLGANLLFSDKRTAA